MQPSCLLLSLRPDRPQIAQFLREQELEVYEASDCFLAMDLVRARNWKAVAVESALPKQSGRDFIKILRELRIFPPKFFLLCRSYDEVRQIGPADYKIMGVLPRPLDDPKKLNAILHTYGIV